MRIREKLLSVLKTKRPLITIKSLWIGDRLSLMERLCITSFLANGHTFELYAYSDIENVPDGTVVKDAHTILSADRIFKYKEFDSYAGFSNIFRYKLLSETRGCWVDTDMVCLKPFDFSQPQFIAGQFRGDRTSTMANCCVIGTLGSTELAAYCYWQASQKTPDELKWGETGPKLINKAAKALKLKKYICDPEVFCPVHWENASDICFTSDSLANYSSSYGIHLWNEMWRRNNLNKEHGFLPDSLYGRLIEKYLPNEFPAYLKPGLTAISN